MVFKNLCLIKKREIKEKNAMLRNELWKRN